MPAGRDRARALDRERDARLRQRQGVRLFRQCGEELAEPFPALARRDEAAPIGDRELHRRERITLLLITHEEHIARAADRIIRLEDGSVASDQRQGQGAPRATPAPPAPAPAAVPAAPRATAKRGKRGRARP